MLSNLSTDATNLLAYLLPGFAAAWLFYGFTSHPKPPQFERVVQALIFTFVIQALLAPTKWALLLAGRFVSVRPWDQESDLIGSLVLACILGTVLAYCTNKDSFHRWLRDKGLTSRTSHPSEWFCAFTEHVTFIILHLKDGRRLYGWPKEWPVDPSKGQFYVQLPSWIDETGKSIDLPQLDGILVHVKDVDWVEFINNTEAPIDDQCA